MNNLLQHFYFLQITILDWKSLGWAFAIFAGFGVKIAFEIAEKVKNGEKVAKAYWIENGCAVFITYIIGYYSGVFIKRFTSNPDVQAGIYALIGALGFSLFRILYRIITDRKRWEKVVDLLITAWIPSKYLKNKKPSDNESGAH
jgi:hypothetical protein